MRDLALQVRGQVDNGDGVEGAFFRADTASDAEAFGNEGDLRVWRNFDAELACSYNGAGFLAFLSTLLGFALWERASVPPLSKTPRYGGALSDLVAIDDGDTEDT